MKNSKSVSSFPWLSLISLCFSNGFVGAICFTGSAWLYAIVLLIAIGMTRLTIADPLAIRSMTQTVLSWLLANGAGRAWIGLSGSVLIPALFLSRLIRELNFLIGFILLGWAIIFAIVALFSLTQLSIYYQDQYSRNVRFLLLSGFTIATLSLFPVLRSLHCWVGRCDLGYVDF